MTSNQLARSAPLNPIPHVIRKFLRQTRNAFTPPTEEHICRHRGPSVLATNLMKSYFERGFVAEARLLFDEMPHRDVVAWTAVIAGYVSCNQYTRAWLFFCDMVKSRADPNEFTLSSVLKACRGLKCVQRGALVHGIVVKRGMEGSLYVDNALMDVYATCSSSMDSASRVFSDIQEKSDVTWTTLIAGYTHRGDGYGGLKIFRQMLLEEVEVNPYSLTTAVRACTSIGSLPIGKQIHALVIKHGFHSDLPVMNSILDLYCRCGCTSEANQYFHEMEEKDLITLNTLLAGCERSDCSEALHIFSQMELNGFSPNCFTFTSVIAACANLAALGPGQQVHGAIIRRGFSNSLALANALIDMYAKCGNIPDSRRIFTGMREQDLVSWTSMMIGYGAHGYGTEAVDLFEEMVKSGTKPDRIVFMAVLSACSHAGLIKEGLKYFELMTSEYKVRPDQDIYGCVVDLLGRAGRVEEAYELMVDMPFKPSESTWCALLGACKAHGAAELGKLVARKVLKLKPHMVGTYLMLSYIYAAEGKWVEFAKVRKLMRRIANKKEAGRSWIEVRDKVFSFVVGDKVGPHIEGVYGALLLLTQDMKEAGYMSELECEVGTWTQESKIFDRKDVWN